MGRNLEEVGLLAFAQAEAPTSAAITDSTSSILSVDPDRAYAILTLESVTGGSVFFSQGGAAVALNGRRLFVDEEHIVYGSDLVAGICGTAAQTAVVLVQVFKRGLIRQGEAV